MISNNMDLLGELLISYSLVNGKISKANPLINMGLNYIEQYVDEVESNLIFTESFFFTIIPYYFSDTDSCFN